MASQNHTTVRTSSRHHTIVGITLFCPLWLHDTTESSKRRNFDLHGFATPDYRQTNVVLSFMVSQHHVTVRIPVLCPSWLHATTWPPEQRIPFACGDGRQRYPVFPPVGDCHWRGTEHHGLESVSTPYCTSLTEGRFHLARDGSLAWMSLWRVITHRPPPLVRLPPPPPPPPLRPPPYSNVSRLTEQSVIRLTSKKDAMPPGADCTIIL